MRAGAALILNYMYNICSINVYTEGNFLEAKAALYF